LDILLQFQTVLSGEARAEPGFFPITDASLDLEVLFDAAEKDLDLPAFFVDVNDALSLSDLILR
jgi:hypothetical protein